MINSSFVDRKLQDKDHYILSCQIVMGEKWNKMFKFCLQLKVDVYDGDKSTLMYVLLYINVRTSIR